MGLLRKIFSLFHSRPKKVGKDWSMRFKCRWKNEIPKYPTYEQFEESWEHEFGKLRYCTVKYSPDNISVKNLSKHNHHLCGRPEYTESPRLKSVNDLYYPGAGCSWGIDLDGVRYYKLDYKTGKIYLKEHLHQHLICRFIDNLNDNLSYEDLSSINLTIERITFLKSIGFPIPKDMIREIRLKKLLD